MSSHPSCTSKERLIKPIETLCFARTSAEKVGAPATAKSTPLVKCVAFGFKNASTTGRLADCAAKVPSINNLARTLTWFDSRGKKKKKQRRELE